VEDKMKKKMLAISVAAVAAAGSAAAVDLPRVPAPYYYPPAPSIYNWAGFYTGLNLSYEWGKVTSSSVDPAGIAVAASLGTTGRLDNSCLAPKQTSKRVQPTTLLHRGNFPTPGLAPCAVEQGTR
jgi:opacity protein-like surface antigen